MSCTSGFLDGVMFHVMGPLGQSQSQDVIFRQVRQMAAIVGRQPTLFGRVRQIAAPGRSCCLQLQTCLELSTHINEL